MPARGGRLSVVELSSQQRVQEALRQHGGGHEIVDLGLSARTAADAAAAVGCRVDQIVKVGAFLSNATLFKPFNEVYARHFGAAPPARTTVVVDFGRADVRVEVEAIAYVGSGDE